MTISQLMYDIDDWCGTKPPRPFPPKHSGLRDMLISVAIHNLAAELTDGRVREGIQTQAGSLFAAASKTLHA